MSYDCITVILEGTGQLEEISFGENGYWLPLPKTCTGKKE